ncbi:MAG: RdgB/HAM1 family non-canonical purine NTP pyrophosphatase [bacterium]
MNNLFLATKNDHKIREIKEILHDLMITVLSYKNLSDIPEIEETGTSFMENSIIKATALTKITNEVSLGDDSGLEVDALDGRPGIFSSRYAQMNENITLSLISSNQERKTKDQEQLSSDEKNINILLKNLINIPIERRTARFKCVITVATPSGVYKSVDGLCEGLIAFEKKGRHGFGYDPVFIVPGYNQTMAELEPAIKNKISHRALALQKTKCIIQEILNK